MSNEVNRQDFIKSIQCEMFKDMIHHFLDESMALYDLIGNKIDVQNIYAAGSDMSETEYTKLDQNDVGIIFCIDAKSDEEAINIDNILKLYSVSCYNHNYSVQTEVKKSKIHIKFNDEVSG